MIQIGNLQGARIQDQITILSYKERKAVFQVVMEDKESKLKNEIMGEHFLQTSSSTCA